MSTSRRRAGRRERHRIGSFEYWHGRMLLESADDSGRARGRLMIEAAATDFRALEMVLHLKLAEQLQQTGV